MTSKLFRRWPSATATREGGYTRVLKLRTRVGDAAPISLVELVDRAHESASRRAAKADEGRRRSRAKAAKAEKSAKVKKRAAAAAKPRQGPQEGCGRLSPCRSRRLAIGAGGRGRRGRLRRAAALGAGAPIRSGRASPPRLRAAAARRRLGVAGVAARPRRAAELLGDLVRAVRGRDARDAAPPRSARGQGLRAARGLASTRAATRSRSSGKRLGLDVPDRARSGEERRRAAYQSLPLSRVVPDRSRRARSCRATSGRATGTPRSTSIASARVIRRGPSAEARSRVARRRDRTRTARVAAPPGGRGASGPNRACIGLRCRRLRLVRTRERLPDAGSACATRLRKRRSGSVRSSGRTRCCATKSQRCARIRSPRSAPCGRSWAGCGPARSWCARPRRLRTGAFDSLTRRCAGGMFNHHEGAPARGPRALRPRAARRGGLRGRCAVLPARPSALGRARRLRLQRRAGPRQAARAGRRARSPSSSLPELGDSGGPRRAHRGRGPRLPERLALECALARPARGPRARGRRLRARAPRAPAAACRSSSSRRTRPGRSRSATAARPCSATASRACSSSSASDVTREYYFNDGGRQMRVLGDSVKARYLEQLGRAAAPPPSALADAELPWPAAIDGLPVRLPARRLPGRVHRRDRRARCAPKHGDALVDEPGDGVFREAAQERIFDEIEATLAALGVALRRLLQRDVASTRRQRSSATLADLRAKDLVYDADGAVWLRATQPRPRARPRAGEVAAASRPTCCPTSPTTATSSAAASTA